MGCGRQYCPNCKQELIHRDNRQSFESSSSLGAILHREGPAEMSLCDIDACIWKKSSNTLRIIEHKQAQAHLGDQQLKSLLKLRTAIDAGIKAGLLDNKSGVYVLRGSLQSINKGHLKVDFSGPQVLESLDREVIIKFTSRQELYDWLNCGSNWSPRNGKIRVEYQ
jgi:hypothetical protein